MSFVSSLLGAVTDTPGRAAKAAADAKIAAEHGVLNATESGQKGIQEQLGSNNINLSNAGQTAIGGVNAATTGANSTLQNTLGGIQSNLNPYISAGATGINSLAKYAGGGGPQFQAPSMADVEQTPGYQFMLKQGSNAINNTAAASGLANSGNTLQALTQFGQGIGQQYYQQAFNNAQGAFQQNQNNTLANLSALTGTGLQANNQSNNAALAIGGQQAQNTLAGGYYGGGTTTDLAKYMAQQGLQGSEYGAGLGMQGATTAGNFAAGAGEDRAAGITGRMNSLGAGLGGAFNMITGGLGG